jgi:hypothetical protein
MKAKPTYGRQGGKGDEEIMGMWVSKDHYIILTACRQAGVGSGREQAWPETDEILNQVQNDKRRALCELLPENSIDKARDFVTIHPSSK